MSKLKIKSSITLHHQKDTPMEIYFEAVSTALKSMPTHKVSVEGSEIKFSATYWSPRYWVMYLLEPVRLVSIIFGHKKISPTVHYLDYLRGNTCGSIKIERIGDDVELTSQVFPGINILLLILTTVLIALFAHKALFVFVFILAFLLWYYEKKVGRRFLIESSRWVREHNLSGKTN